MRTVNPNKCVLKWNRSRFGELSHSFTLNDEVVVASIFPKETKDGRLHWGFWIDRKCGEELSTEAPKEQLDKFNLLATFPKRKEAKKRIEDVVKNLIKVKNGNPV